MILTPSLLDFLDFWRTPPRIVTQSQDISRKSKALAVWNLMVHPMMLRFYSQCQLFLHGIDFTNATISLALLCHETHISLALKSFGRSLSGADIMVTFDWCYHGSELCYKYPVLIY